MRSHEQRVAAVRRRIAAEERKQRLRRSWGLTGCAAAAALALIAAAALQMPDMVRQMDADGYASVGAAASIFGGGSSAVGYLLIGLLSFLLGVCITVLCFRIRRFQRESRETEERDG